MVKISDRAIALVADGAGFDDKNLATAIAVALAESGGNRDAISPTNDYGLWQINKKAHPQLFTKYQWNKEVDNAKMAKQVWDGAGWSAWSAYKNGSYLRYKSRAEKVAKEYITNRPDDLPNPLDPLNTAITSVNNIVSFITDPNNWIRVGYFIGGLLLLSLAAWKLTDTTPAKAVKVINQIKAAR